MRFVKGFLMVVGAGVIVLAALWYLAGRAVAPPEKTEASSEPTAPIPQAVAIKPHSGCVLKYGVAVVCSSGLAAVIAYQRYGDDAQAMRKSYSKAALQQAGCFVITDDGKKILQAGRGKVPLSDGWVGVTNIIVGDSMGIIDNSFLDGVCEQHQVEHLVMPPIGSQPDYGGSSEDKSDKVGVTGGAATPPQSASDNVHQLGTDLAH